MSIGIPYCLLSCIFFGHFYFFYCNFSAPAGHLPAGALWGGLGNVYKVDFSPNTCPQKPPHLKNSPWILPTRLETGWNVWRWRRNCQTESSHLHPQQGKGRKNSLVVLGSFRQALLNTLRASRGREGEKLWSNHYEKVENRLTSPDPWSLISRLLRVDIWSSLQLLKRWSFNLFSTPHTTRNYISAYMILKCFHFGYWLFGRLMIMIS